MIITKAKHNEIVSFKDADIQRLENKVRSLSKSLYKHIEEKENIAEDLKIANAEISMKNETIKELVKDKNSLKANIAQLKECMNSDEKVIVDLCNALNRFEMEKARTEEVKRQYKEYIHRALEIVHIEHFASTQDIEKFASKEGARGIIDLYMLASLM
ncbi:MAG: hypothetical protein ACRDB0_05085 [Paraclostridium sp.]